jgi:hypothetical protein
MQRHDILRQKGIVMSKKELQVRTETHLPVEFSALKENKSLNELMVVMPEHKGMLTEIKKNLPEIQRATSLFGKTQSQFMDNMMTVSANTPIRNLRQILAQMTQTREAIKEANFKLKKKEIEAKIKERDLENEPDELKRALLQVEVDELNAGLESTKIYLSGAVRTLANYTAQYNSVMEEYGLKDFNEEDFEKEEERYHIMKAFEQALCAARSHQGWIDEGNHIYLAQIGINGAHAQFRVHEFLQEEQKLMAEGKAPTHKAYTDFLHRMADEFQGCSEDYAVRKGMKTRTESALIQEGDTRLLGPNVPPKLLSKIKKLYNMSKSANENEASRASEKLTKLLDKNSLNLKSLEKYLK